MRPHLSVAAAFLVVAAPSARAQSDAPLPSYAPAPLAASRFALGGGVAVAQPVGEFRSVVANGWGGSGHVRYRLDRAGVLGVRADLGLVNYGRERADARISGRTSDDLYLETTHRIFWVAAGPQLVVPSGPVRPYVNAQVGLAFFNTGTSLKRDEPFDDDDEVESWNDHGDETRTWGAGGGVLVRLATGISLDVGARYHGNGTVQYKYEAPGAVGGVGPVRSRANLWTYQIGVSLGGW